MMQPDHRIVGRRLRRLRGRSDGLRPSRNWSVEMVDWWERPKMQTSHPRPGEMDLTMPSRREGEGDGYSETEQLDSLWES
jgi:hypothetical protein